MDTNTMRGEIEYRLIEARATLDAKEAANRAEAPRSHFVVPQYELGYVHALEWMLNILTDDAPAEEPGPELTDEQLAQLESEA